MGIDSIRMLSSTNGWMSGIIYGDFGYNTPVMWHWDGQTWSAADWPSAAGEGYVPGDDWWVTNGVMLNGTGTSWVIYPTGGGSFFTSAAQLSGTEGWAVGTADYHVYDGTPIYLLRLGPAQSPSLYPPRVYLPVLGMRWSCH